LRPVITITTDFGTRDGFVAQMKGVILRINPDARIVDVTHDIAPYSIMEAALVLKGIHRHFPDGTIHLAVVDPGVGGARRAIVARSRRRLYVGPDNGLFSLVLTPQQPWEVRQIENPEFIAPRPHPTFHGRDIFAPVAAHLSLGAPFEAVGWAVADPVFLSVPEVRRTGNELHGEVIHIDRFGNLTTNIESAMIDRRFESVEMRGLAIRGLSRSFCQVLQGQALALINSFGYLEIAVNRGNAAQSLGVSKGEKVTVCLSPARP